MDTSMGQKCPDPSPRVGSSCGFQQPFTLKVHDLDCSEPVEHRDFLHCSTVPPGILNPLCLSPSLGAGNPPISPHTWVE